MLSCRRASKDRSIVAEVSQVVFEVVGKVKVGSVCLVVEDDVDTLVYVLIGSFNNTEHVEGQVPLLVDKRRCPRLEGRLSLGNAH